jgi:hypothetical protein
MTEFNYARCPKCGPIVDGAYCGHLMYKGVISIHHRTKPNTPIAYYVRCAMCKYVHEIYLIPGAEYDGKRQVSDADKLGIELHNVKACFKALPMDLYTLAELKAGKVRGVGEVELDIQYDPDKTIENRVDKEFE